MSRVGSVVKPNNLTALSYLILSGAYLELQDTRGLFCPCVVQGRAKSEIQPNSAQHKPHRCSMAACAVLSMVFWPPVAHTVACTLSGELCKRCPSAPAHPTPLPHNLPLPNPTRRMDDEDDGRADVDDNTAGGLFSWLGRDAAERRGVHAGTHLGTTRMTAA